MKSREFRAKWSKCNVKFFLKYFIFSLESAKISPFSAKIRPFWAILGQNKHFLTNFRPIWAQSWTFGGISWTFGAKREKFLAYIKVYLF